MNLNDYLKHNKDLLRPFALFSKPNTTTLTGVFQNNSKHYTTSDYTESGFVFAPFYGQHACLIPLDHAQVVIQECPVMDPVQTEQSLDFSADSEAKFDFENLVHLAVKAIKKGAFDKVVLSREETVAFAGKDFFQIFIKLKMNYPDAFCSMFYHPEVGLWMGATPEGLFKIERDSFETMALAGTQKNNDQKEVFWGEKEKQEQRYVTDFIVASLERFSDQIKVSEPFTKRAAKVMHICTQIKGYLKPEAELKQILESIHPTPAVCGMPKEASRDYILKHEGYNRAYYAGFLGPLNWGESQEKQTDLYVNLRCMQLQDTTATLYIGCGITQDSIAEDEFVETQNKATTMKKILN